MLRVGLIADTHNLLRDEAVAFLRGSDHIIHAGDIMDESIIQSLETLAPVTVVRGNNDRSEWGLSLPETAYLTLEATGIYVIHDLAELTIDPAEVGARVVISGHSHKPSITERDGMLYINPGSAGRRRFKLPIAVAELTIAGEELSARIVELPVPAR
ncbi:MULTISPECIES: metallophosphoesterase family protein [Pseudomonas]|uniref:metallophosphoesterase family protein n=1 Tax=Pseudomonas TaxID=286 RepID=UPI00123C6E38|nr:MULTISPECIES: metallophosphoesterase family protein [Pseudomonas]QIB49825.1 metallophosphoesterase family protein [Pseudomonas sp. OIL-1]